MYCKCHTIRIKKNKICKFASSVSESVDQAVEKYGLQKITLLREISIKTGIQVMLLSACSFPCMSHECVVDTLLWPLSADPY